MTSPDEIPHSKKNLSVYPSKKTLFILIGASICMLFLAVFLFTRPSFTAAFDLTNKGTIGDAINGITGPIIALISAGLLFYSFQAQLEANKHQLKANEMLKSQWEFDTYLKLYGEIEKVYEEKFRTTVMLGGVVDKEYVGWAYLEFFASNMETYLSDTDKSKAQTFVWGHLNPIEFVLEDLVVLILYVRSSNLPQKQFFLHRVDRFYTSKLEVPLTKVYVELPKSFQNSHTLYNKLVSLITSLRNEELKTDIIFAYD